MISVPGYQTLDIIHENPTTSVARGRRDADGKQVVIRLANPAAITPRTRLRFRHEVELLKQLNSPLIIQAEELVENDEILALITEDTGYQSLDIIAASRQLTPAEVILVGMSLTRALDFIHRAGTIHCDINPSNVLMGDDPGTIKLIDFDLALSSSDNTIRQALDYHSIDEIEGTINYMSPEQTGRINRIVDYRTDFYSLGVTLYELLTGHLPFDADGSLETIHNHIAKQPLPPVNNQYALPEKLKSVILKLMEKLAENRYQYARTIYMDLAACLKETDAPEWAGPPSEFVEEAASAPARLNLTQKVCGRAEEKELLRAYFERVASGEGKIIFFSGEAGTGKSALVKELQGSVAQRRGYFVTSKYSAIDKNIAYLAFTTPLQQLIRHILSEPDLDNTRKMLVENLKGNGQLLINILPELETIIGKQPEVPVLPPDESRMRLALTFSRFLRAIATREHPVVMFLDDLQHIDISSIELLETLLFTSKIPYLFAIGAVESGAFATNDSRLTGLINISQNNEEIERFDLAPLTLMDTQQIIAESLSQSTQQVLSLARIAHRKTGGNPYFIREFLNTLFQEQHLIFNIQSASWRWNLEAAERQDIAENVSVLLANKISSLPGSTLRVLKTATCFPESFSISMLASLTDSSVREIEAELIPAINGAYIIKSSPKSRRHLAESDEYRFSHVRVHHAIYSLLSTEEREHIHERIGNNLLLVHQDNIDGYIFEIANQLNNSIELALQRPQQRQKLAELNLLAGQKSKASSAYQPAYKYFKTALALSEPHAQGNYDFILKLYLEAAQCAYLCGDEKQLNLLLQQAVALTNNRLDEARVLEIKLKSEIYQKNSVAAMETGNDILRLLNLEVPAFGGRIYATILFGSFMITNQLQIKHPYEKSSRMTDPGQLLAMRVLTSLVQVSYFSGNQQALLYVLKMVQLSEKYGMAPESVFAYPLYGALLISSVGRIEAGYRFGKMAIDNLDDGGKEYECRTITLVYNLILCWKQHLRESIEPLTRAYETGIEVGDTEFALIAAMGSCINIFMLGYELSGLAQTLDRYNQEAGKANELMTLSIGSIYQQATLNLLTETKKPWLLEGDVYDERISYPYHQETQDQSTLSNLYIAKLFLAVLFNRGEEACTYAAEVRSRLVTIWSTSIIPFFYFYESLAILSQLGRLKGLPRMKAVARVRANQRALKKWAEHAPMNILHKYHLVTAEKNKHEGNHALAIEHYEKALLYARNNGYLNEEALANELIGNFYYDQHRNELAGFYLRKAKSCYARWGAVSKVTDLDRHFRTRVDTVGSFELTRFQTAGMDGDLQLAPSESTLGSILDLGSVIKASQALASELVLEEVLKQLMQVVLENAAANKACLILNEQEILVQEIIAVLDEPEAVHRLDSIPLTSSGDLPVSVIQYVARTREDLVLNNVVEEDIFTQDPYIVEHRPLSILCIPVIHQSHLTGILYLENSLIIDAFSPDRLSVLKLLASQSAIAIENAKLYREIDESRDRYLSLYENAIEGIFEADEYGRLVHLNPAVTNLLGYSSAESLIQEVNKPGVVFFDNSAESHSFYQSLLEQNRVVEFEKALSKQGGEIIWVSMSAQMVAGKDGKHRSFEGSIIDISERKRREEAEQARLMAEAATEAKSEFLAKMSHEIRTPMNAILGYTNLALSTELDSKQTTYLETIKTSSHHLMRVINDILDISKIEAGRVELYNQPFSLATLFSELSSLFLLEKNRKQIDLLFPDIEAMDLPSLYGDPVRIGQILINLIGNAIKFTDEGKVQVVINQTPLNLDKMKLSFSIIDTGIGIDDSQVGSIFNSFTQATSPGESTSPYQLARQSGTGLGLAICKHLIDLMGGAISVKSTLGVGSRFDFFIYVGIDSGAAHNVISHSGGSRRKRSWLKGIKVLLVEDNQINQQLVCEVMESEGIIVDLAENGKQAISAMSKHEYAAVLMDLRMPIMDGYTATEILRRDKTYNHIPIIALSAGVLQHEIDKALKLGFDDYETKPINFNNLLNKLLALIDDRYFQHEINPLKSPRDDQSSYKSQINIPEINLAKALTNHNNNITLFVRLLNDFVTYYEIAATTIEQHLATDEREQAERLAHNIAGVAGSFAAEDLHNAAKKLEYAIIAGDKSGWQTALPGFASTLSALIQSIKAVDTEAVKKSARA